MPARDAAGTLAARIKSFRSTAKVWKKQNRFIPLLDNNCKFVIELLDFFEEGRVLSGDELDLWRDARRSLELSVLRRAAFWKQRGKFRALAEGDSNTKFFHARASQRYRRNNIRALDVVGEVTVAHGAKAAALHRFYSELLGRAPPTRWGFCLEDLYRGCASAHGPELVAPFGDDEIKAAVSGMDRSSAPGPDGLGPSFYHAAWGTIAPDLTNLFAGFHAMQVDLSGINRAHVVLLPKRDGILDPGAYRPISLQNCSMKTICKGLTTRLQKQIGSLVDVDQSGFLAGRSISENFVYAAELVQTCYKRKSPTLVFKLDFAKAFDSVDWASLRKIMEVRGFPPLWCDWIENIVCSSRSAILLNGIPGRWFNCKRGLRQGDPLSPYLFLLVADVL
jgi:hypothetical protein